MTHQRLATMFRALPFSNRICEEKARLRARELHLERKEVTVVHVGTSRSVVVVALSRPPC